MTSFKAMAFDDSPSLLDWHKLPIERFRVGLRSTAFTRKA